VINEKILSIVEESIETKRRFFEANADKVARAAQILVDALKEGGKIMIFGNGGSAADAQHIAAELVNRLNRDHPPIAAIALTTDTSIITSIANDTSFDELFERQVLALGKPGDAVLAISTSGNSVNVLRAVAAARRREIHTIALTGKDGGQIAAISDLALIVAARSTQRIQETHITIAHILCELIEDSLYPDPDLADVLVDDKGAKDSSDVTV
jgi:D-sedoheptulose 7-phosphate isomerase